MPHVRGVDSGLHEVQQNVVHLHIIPLGGSVQWVAPISPNPP